MGLIPGSDYQTAMTICGIIHNVHVHVFTYTHSPIQLHVHTCICLQSWWHQIGSHFWIAVMSLLAFITRVHSPAYISPSCWVGTGQNFGQLLFFLYSSCPHDYYEVFYNALLCMHFVCQALVPVIYMYQLGCMVSCLCRHSTDGYRRQKID